MPFKFSIIFSQQFAWQENCHSRGLRRDAQWWLDVASSGTTRKGKSRNPRCLGSHDEKSVEPWHLSCGMDHLIIACQMSYLYTYIYNCFICHGWVLDGLGGVKDDGSAEFGLFCSTFPLLLLCSLHACIRGISRYSFQKLEPPVLIPLPFWYWPVPVQILIRYGVYRDFVLQGHECTHQLTSRMKKYIEYWI